LLAKHTFEVALERVRRSFQLCVYGYVVMPEHVHLLISEPREGTLADALKSLKQGLSRRWIDGATHFWQKRYYDFNVRNHQQFVEKLRYIHRNPVKRGLCDCPENWEWSSFRHYAAGCEGTVELESEWTGKTARTSGGKTLVQQWNCPTQANTRLEWATRDGRVEKSQESTPGMSDRIRLYRSYFYL
jgi:putative transposase